MSQPLAIDLFCGLGGWAEGLLAEGWCVIGFDIERHDYGTGVYPGELVLQDVRTLHGAQFKDADLIVASPPCQFFSRMAMPFRMPWKQEEYERRRNLAHDLFWQCFRIQHEAEQAAGHCIPLIVENVCGAQKWVGPARWHFGSYYLYGDVPALMPQAGSIKNGNLGGGSWFGISATNTVLGMNQDGRKIAHAGKQLDGVKRPGMNWSDRDNPDRMFNDPRKTVGRDGHKGPMRNDPRDIRRDENGDWVNRDGTKFGGGWWHDANNNLIRKASSRSQARKAASAQIAKIPFPLAQHIARVFKPEFAGGTPARCHTAEGM